ncbi:MAG: hypothetical protein JSV10_03790 [Candidatus Zixiibacteriota bacterium]|nr:MAG: hypothetical protein JSV10_03790 [candidate division Zixibacteria bacterium]
MNRINAGVLKRRVFLFLPVLALALWLQPSVQALGISPEPYTVPFFPDATYDADVPAPDEILGHPVGSRPCGYQDVVSYFKMLDQSSPRAKLFDYAKTHEGRILYYLVISSEENMTELEKIKQSMSRLADPRKLKGESGALSLTDNTPAIAWMGYSVHGDELSSTDAALQVAYQLAAGTDSLTQTIRDQVVTLVDPLQNPDGRERYLKQLETSAGAVPNFDDQSLQHGGFWPWGRANHYLFDLNRDWFALVQPESRGKVRTILQWNPQVVIDGHEMGPLDTYLFSPPREPFLPPLSNTLKKWWDVFARDQAKAFDRYGWSYYTGDWLEMWFPGYANSWALYTGALGILYEQAGVGGSAVRRKDGSLLTYRESVHHQFVSSMANLATLAENRVSILKDFYKEKRRAAQGGNSPVKTFLFMPGKNQSRVDRLVGTLLLQGIEVHKAEADFTAGRVRDFWGGSLSQKRFPAGTYMVHLDQPLSPLIRAILEFDHRMPESFLREERKELEKKQRTKMIEVSAWSVPMAYNVETYWTENKVNTKSARVTEVDRPEGQVVNHEPRYGYIFDYSDDKATDALALLLEEGFKVRVAQRPFKIEGREFSRGSILLVCSENSPGIHNFVEELAQKTKVMVYGVNTALSDEGPDLGGNRFRLLEVPRIGLFAGSPVDFTSYGSIWHLLDQKLGMRFSSLDIGGLWQVDLDKYSVLVLPAVWGGPKTYVQVLGRHGIQKLRKWIQNGGTFITVGAGAAFAADTTVKLSQVRLRRQVLDKLAEYEQAVRRERQAEEPSAKVSMIWDYSPREEEKSEESTKAEGKPKQAGGLEQIKGEDERLRTFMPRGVILRADLDQEHWLTSGMDHKVPIMMYSEFAFMSKRPVQTAARLSEAENLRLSGLLWPEARERWANTAYLTRERSGKGQVILFAFQPDFRGYFHGTERLLINALLFGPGLGTSRPAPW